METKEIKIQPVLDRKAKRANTVYKKVKLFITISAFVLAIIFTWLNLDLKLFKPLFINESADLLFKLSIVLYYFSWISGGTFDLNDQEYTFRIYPNNNKLTNLGVFILVFLVVLFGLLCYSNTVELFVIVLSGFFVGNVLSWWYLVERIFIKTIEENEKQVTDYFDIEYQNNLKRYLMGNWQVWRFAYAFIYIAFLNILIFSDLHLILSDVLNVSSELIISIGFLFFVLSFELWVWYMRFDRMITFKAYDKLDDLYELNLKPIKNEE